MVHLAPAPRNAQRRTLDDGPLEQLRRFRGGHEVGDGIAAGGLPERRHPPRISAERGNVPLHPAEGLKLVQQPQVSGPARMRGKEAEQPQPVGHRDHYYAVFGHQNCRIKDGQVARTRGVGTAVDPHHHRQLLAGGKVGRHGDGEVLAVLTARKLAVAGAQDVVEEGNRTLRAGRGGGCGR
jgi:hypothetical protein